jgi:hypothetical protein
MCPIADVSCIRGYVSDSVGRPAPIIARIHEVHPERARVRQNVDDEEPSSSTAKLAIRQRSVSTSSSSASTAAALSSASLLAF